MILPFKNHRRKIICYFGAEGNENLDNKEENNLYFEFFCLNLKYDLYGILFMATLPEYVIL